MDLFITSRITEKFSYLAEVGFEADDSTNGVGVDLERAQITYMPNESFSVSAAAPTRCSAITTLPSITEPGSKPPSTAPACLNLRIPAAPCPFTT